MSKPERITYHSESSNFLCVPACEWVYVLVRECWFCAPRRFSLVSSASFCMSFACRFACRFVHNRAVINSGGRQCPPLSNRTKKNQPMAATPFFSSFSFFFKPTSVLVSSRYPVSFRRLILRRFDEIRVKFDQISKSIVRTHFFLSSFDVIRKSVGSIEFGQIPLVVQGTAERSSQK